MKILHIDSSVNGQQSASRQVSAAIVRRLMQNDPAATVTYRDLVSAPVPHHSEGRAGDSAPLQEFLAADVVVIGAPMYNFSVPSQLKAWIDALAVAGVTFSYDAAGPKGLCGSKRIIVASTRGGIYSAPSPLAAMDQQESLLTSFFARLLGAQVEFVRAEGIGLGEEQRRRAMDQALSSAAMLRAA